jgi:hypothetical protein
MQVPGGILRDLGGSEIPPKAPPNLLAQAMRGSRLQLPHRTA